MFLVGEQHGLAAILHIEVRDDVVIVGGELRPALAPVGTVMRVMLDRHWISRRSDTPIARAPQGGIRELRLRSIRHFPGKEIEREQHRTAKADEVGRRTSANPGRPLDCRLPTAFVERRVDQRQFGFAKSGRIKQLLAPLSGQRVNFPPAAALSSSNLLNEKSLPIRDSCAFRPSTIFDRPSVSAQNIGPPR